MQVATTPHPRAITKKDANHAAQDVGYVKNATQRSPRFWVTSAHPSHVLPRASSRSSCFSLDNEPEASF